MQLVAGLVVLGWSADRFVMAAAAVARHLGLPPLLIGMVVIGFGTSAPELVVSSLAAVGGAPELALGNAYGSNIANIALIIGVMALISPIAVHRGVIRREIPLLLAVTALSFALLADRGLSRLDAGVLLGAFALFLGWSVTTGLRSKGDRLAADVEQAAASHPLSLRAGWAWLAGGLIALAISSHFLVQGAVGIAQRAGLSDLVIGLTVVAVGTSLPELASSVAAARKGEHDLAVGNIVGSNMFNTLAVVGLAGMIAPATVSPEVLTRDLPVVALLTAALVLFAVSRRRERVINRGEGGVLAVAFVTYTAYLLATAV